MCLAMLSLLIPVLSEYLKRVKNAHQYVRHLVTNISPLSGPDCYHYNRNAVAGEMKNGLADYPPHFFYMGKVDSAQECEIACRNVSCLYTHIHL